MENIEWTPQEYEKLHQKDVSVSKMLDVKKHQNRMNRDILHEKREKHTITPDEEALLKDYEIYEDQINNVFEILFELRRNAVKSLDEMKKALDSIAL